MSGIGLRSVINSSLVQSFTGLAQGSRSGSSLARSLSGQSTANSLSEGLRIGARTYSTALQGLNTAISFVNLSRSTLEDLGELTDKLIDVVSRATKSSISQQTRNDLDIKFKKLGSEFKEIVSESSLGGTEYLSTDGLAQLFNQIGLNQNDSRSIAAIFSKFVTPEDDSVLASEKSKATTSVPAGAFTRPGSDQQFILEMALPFGSDSNFAAISSVTSLSATEDVFLGQNPLIKTAYSSTLDGTISTLDAGMLTNLMILDINETTGEYLIESSDDLLGFNAGGFSQLYLVGTDGTVLHQYTTNTTATITHHSASLSGDNQTMVAIRSDSGSGAQRVFQMKVGGLGEDPTLSDATIIEAGPPGVYTFDQIKVNNAGDHVAYLRNDIVGGTSSIIFRDHTNTLDAALAADTNNTKFGFTNNNRLAIIRDNGATDSVTEYVYGSGSYATHAAAITVGEFTTLERVPGTNGYYAYENTTTHTVGVFGGSDRQRLVHVGAGSTVHGLSLAFNLDQSGNNNDNLDLGINGNLNGLTGINEDRLYRSTVNPRYQAEQAVSSVSTEYETVFDSERSIRSRPEAFRVLGDLKTLRSQIKDNISALDNATKVIEKNVDLVRATGSAFLELSNTIDNETDADQVAQKLRELIRRDAKSALSQAENLDSIAVAALSLTGP